MLSHICEDAQSAAAWVGSSAIAQEVLAAMALVPRHEFVPKGLVHAAYHDSPLPIGYGQTISQPYIVALMTDLLQVDRASRVLEVGTGSGYQAAVLSRLVSQVYSLEIVEALADGARQRLRRLGYTNIEVVQANGRQGLPDEAPFDAVVVTAAAEVIPQALIDQLAVGGRLVAPVGPEQGGQGLVLLKKGDAGAVTGRTLLPVAFVPLVG